jgi:hypothetical protein
MDEGPDGMNFIKSNPLESTTDYWLCTRCKFRLPPDTTPLRCPHCDTQDDANMLHRELSELQGGLELAEQELAKLRVENARLREERPNTIRALLAVCRRSAARYVTEEQLQDFLTPDGAERLRAALEGKGT